MLESNYQVKFQKMTLEELHMAYDFCHKIMYDLSIENEDNSSYFSQKVIQDKIAYYGNLMSVIFQQIIHRKTTQPTWV